MWTESTPRRPHRISNFSEQKSSQRPSIHQKSPKNGRLTESPHPIWRGDPPWTLEQKGSDHGRSGLSYGQ